MKEFRKLLVLFGVLANPLIVHAENANDVATGLAQQLKRVFGEKQIRIEDYDDMLKLVTVDATQFFYTSHDGRYVFAGPVFDTRREVDIVAEKQAGFRKSVLASLPEDTLLSYPSTDVMKHEVTVFTDIDCPYCRKLHTSLPQINQRGVSVNYVMVPRGGEGSPSYQKTLSAFCADKPAASITRAMQNQVPEPLRCDASRLKQQMALARQLNITSTPTVVLPNGELKIGLISPDQLIGLLEKTQ